MKLVLVGVSHHETPVELRERVAIDAADHTSLTRSLAGRCEAVVLSTCNRTELYLAGEGDLQLEEWGRSSLMRLAATGAPALAPLIYRLNDDRAALHLFRVVAGLDSLIPGEREILGQVRAAYEAGATGPLLDRLFRQALHVGRTARVQTAIGENPASVPAAAAALAQRVFGELRERQVLLIGAGRISELVARNLRSRGAVIAAVANRTVAHGEALAHKIGTRAVTLAAIPGLLPEVDIVVSSTGAPGFLVDSATARPRLQERRGRQLLFVDLAVPRDIDPALHRVDGCLIYDLDDLEAVVETSLNGRRAEMARAEELVAAEAERFREWQASLSVVSAIASLRMNAEKIRSAELSKAHGRLERLPESDRELVELLTARIVAKLLHLPTVRMKEAAALGEGAAYSDAMRRLFELEQ